MRTIYCFALLLILGGCAGVNQFPVLASKVAGSGVLFNVEKPLPPTWFDADFGCGENAKMFSDIDDCAALPLLKNSGADLIGISTTFGNVSADEAYRTARAIAGDTPIYQGGSSACDSSAVRGFANATTGKRVLVFAMGPLTNVAAFIDCGYGERIERVVFVGGKRSGEAFVLNPEHTYVDLPDLNVVQDRAAVRTVLASNVALTLVPFEAGRMAPINLATLEAWDIPIPESARSRFESWDWFSRFVLGSSGMPLWDLHAVAAALFPQHFTCMEERAEATSDELMVGTGDRKVTYCLPNNPDKLREAELLLLAVPAKAIAAN